MPVNHLFVEYKNWIETKDPFKTVTAEVEALAGSRETYRDFICACPKTRIGEFGYFLESFDVGTVHPLMLVLAETKVSLAELEGMLKCLESYLLRRAVCGLSTKAYNRIFLNLAEKMSTGGATAAMLRDRLSALTGESALWPTDAAFGEAFVTRAGYRTLNHAKIVYILKRLNETYHSSFSEKVTIDTALVVEHLMPQKWQEHWPFQIEVDR